MRIFMLCLLFLTLGFSQSQNSSQVKIDMHGTSNPQNIYNNNSKKDFGKLDFKKQKEQNSSNSSKN
ncbi:MAG: hypothetical protein ACK5LP_08035 [Campylobacteraceae bacterium]